MFRSQNPTSSGLYWIHSDGSGEAQRLTDDKLPPIPFSFSPDGKRLALMQLTGAGGSPDIVTADRRRCRAPQTGKVRTAFSRPGRALADFNRNQRAPSLVAGRS